MKLTLSDGTPLRILGYSGTYLNINGENIEAVEISVAGTTLETIKSTFQSGENLAVINMYEDDNVLRETLYGFSVRKAITIGEDDQTYTITLAKTSDLQEKVRILEQVNEAMTCKLERLTSTNTMLEEELNSLKSVLGDPGEMINGVNGMKDIVESMRESVNDVIERVNSHTEKMGQVEQRVATTNENVATMSDRVARMQSELREAASNASESLKYADNANNTMLANKTKLENVDRSFNQARNDVASSIAETQRLTQYVNMKAVEVEAVVGESQTTLEKTTDLHEKITKLIEVPDIRSLPLDEAKTRRIQESCDALENYLATHPITSTCHSGVEAQYSITEKKQAYLQAMILMTTTAAQNGIEYQPSWNATGEECTYDWTIEELQMLAVEIESVVRPLVSHQQSIETMIRSAETMDELCTIEISFEGIAPNQVTFKQDPSDPE